VCAFVYVCMCTEAFDGQILRASGLTMCQETRFINWENEMPWIALAGVAMHTDRF
jgi:hypothetical protein